MTMEEQPVPGGSERILIVDDQDAVIAILSKILEELGYTVLSASTTEDALRIARESEFDLLVTDVVMPPTSGMTMATEITALRPDVPILYMSGYMTDEVLEDHGTHGAGISFVQKPFERRTLAERVRSLLDG